MTGETVTWHHRTDTGTRDRYNKPILEDTDDDLDGVLVAPNLGDEVTGTAEDTANTRVTLYLPTPIGVSAADEITVRGLRYRVIGNEADWSTGLSDWNPGAVVQLSRSESVSA